MSQAQPQPLPQEQIMKQMILDIPCKTGKLQVTKDGSLRVQRLPKKTVWQVPCTAIIGLTTQPGAFRSVNVSIHSSQGVYQADMVTKRNFAKLQTLFPLLSIPTTQMVMTYHSGFTGSAENKFAKDAAKLAQQGWRVQSQSTAAHPWTGKPRAITVVYVRS